MDTNNITPMLIGITGQAGAGKTTAANYLVEEYGFKRVRFAGAIKAMLKALLACTGMKDDLIYDYIEGQLKEEPCPELNGKTPRYAMQTLGTEWGRELLGPDIWKKVAILEIEKLQREGFNRIVIDDVRFTNEASSLRMMNGYIINIKGRYNEKTPKHPSEEILKINGFQFNVFNFYDIDDLRQDIHFIMRDSFKIKTNKELMYA